MNQDFIFVNVGRVEVQTITKMDGIQLKKLREQYGLTQLEIAEAIGTTFQRISEWENLKYKISSSYQRLLKMYFEKKIEKI